ncbi:MAG: DUF2807 domain-containing protein [Candidatus Marinimicrobia bacterium]|nr:DUF2807 domain-containing protein [Candidatus Neomarinimicrobiota bacterium]
MKIKSIIPIFTFAVISLLFAGETVTETRDVSGYDWVVLDGSGDVTVIQGKEEKVIVKADKDIINRVVTEVDGNKLHLGLKTEWNWHPKSMSTIHYTVYIKNVAGLSVHGSGDVNADKIASDDMNAHISGSGEISIEYLKCDDLDVSINGSGECEVGGKTNRQNIHISGSGDYTAKQFASKMAEVHISGSGDVILQVEDELEVFISGSGDVVYYGSPDVSEHVSGSGDVTGKGAASH